MNRKKQKNQGFSLIELLVVISIIGVLASVTLVLFDRQRSRSRDIKRITDITAISKALDLYYADNGRYPQTTNPGSLIQSSTSAYWNNLTAYIKPTTPPPGEGYRVRVIGQPSGTTAGKVGGETGCMFFPQIGQGYWVGTRSLEVLTNFNETDGGVSDFYYEKYGGRYLYKAGVSDCPASIFQ